MEEVSVKLVMFRQKTFHEEGECCGYCPALEAFHVFNSFDKLLEYMQNRLFRELESRLQCKNLQKMGWQVSENSAKPPIFANEMLIRLTEECFETKIKEPIIVELYAELPPARDRYAHLSNTHKDT